MACLKLPESLLPHLITGNVRKVMTSSIAFRVRMYHFVMMHVGNFKLESSQEAVHQTTDLHCTLLLCAAYFLCALFNSKVFCLVDSIFQPLSSPELQVIHSSDLFHEQGH